MIGDLVVDAEMSKLIDEAENADDENIVAQDVEEDEEPDLPYVEK